jgi:hypothetical protein
MKEWRENNPDKILEYSSNHRGFGYTPINSCFNGSHGHHVFLEGRSDFVIHYPNFLHEPIYHDHKDPESMVEPNTFALDFWVNEYMYDDLYEIDRTSTIGVYDNCDTTETQNSYMNFNTTEELKMED